MAPFFQSSFSQLALRKRDLGAAVAAASVILAPAVAALVISDTFLTSIYEPILIIFYRMKDNNRCMLYYHYNVYCTILSCNNRILYCL